jgi:hypothetical protein
MMLWALMQRATHNMPSGNQAVTFVFSEGLDAIPAITKAAVRKNITKANSTMARSRESSHDLNEKRDSD